MRLCHVEAVQNEPFLVYQLYAVDVSILSAHSFVELQHTEEHSSLEVVGDMQLLCFCCNDQREAELGMDQFYVLDRSCAGADLQRLNLQDLVNRRSSVMSWPGNQETILSCF